MHHYRHYCGEDGLKVAVRADNRRAKTPLSQGYHQIAEECRDSDDEDESGPYFPWKRGELDTQDVGHAQRYEREDGYEKHPFHEHIGGIALDHAGEPDIVDGGTQLRGEAKQIA